MENSDRLYKAAVSNVEVKMQTLRDLGWLIAIHNDYTIYNQRMCFYLWTHTNGQWIKGEGPTDEIALDECLKYLEKEKQKGRPIYSASSTDAIYPIYVDIKTDKNQKVISANDVNKLVEQLRHTNEKIKSLDYKSLSTPEVMQTILAALKEAAEKDYVPEEHKLEHMALTVIAAITSFNAKKSIF